MRMPHPLIAQYVRRHGVADAVKENGQAVLLIDAKYRVTLSSDAAGWLVLLSRLAPLPDRTEARQRLCIDVALQATGLLSTYASTCVVDSEDSALWLQQTVPPGSTAVEVDDALADFVNALEVWMREFGDIAAWQGMAK